MKYAYYPGCSLHSTGQEFDVSLKAVCARLGVELVEVDQWICCGSSAAHNLSQLMATALPMANLARLPEMGMEEVVIPCAACFSRFKIAQHGIKNNKNLRRQVVEVIHRDCNDEAKVTHPLTVFAQEPLISRIPTVVQRNLSGLKVACYYGCLLTRPPKVTEFDCAEYPMTMDNVLRATGIATVDWPHKTICCGASHALSKPGIVVNLSHRVIEEAKSAGADAIAVACPMCQANLDTRQDDMQRKFGTHPQMPIFYFTQLMGYSFGYSTAQLCLNRHLTDAEKLLEEVGQPAWDSKDGP